MEPLGIGLSFVRSTLESISRSLISALNVKDDLSNIYENQRLIKEKYNWEKKQKDNLTLFKTQ